MKIASKFFMVEMIKVHYLKEGEGQQVVLLLHGGGLDLGELSWELLIPELVKKKARVIALDWPGYGRSDKQDVLFDLPFYLNFFPQFMDAIEIQQWCDRIGLRSGSSRSS